MGTPALQIPIIDKNSWAYRLCGLTPKPWTSDAAKTLGGVLFSAMDSVGYELNKLNIQENFVLDSARIATATDVALDLVTLDFFGGQLPRVPAEPDSSFRSRIQSLLLYPQLSRTAISNMIQRIVGIKPRILEPWNPGDCGAWDDPLTFFDLDTAENPSRYMDPGLPCSAFIETALPPYSLPNNAYPIFTYDSGLFYDSPISMYLDPLPTWFIGAAQMDQLINRLRAAGVTIWRKYQAVPLQTNLIGKTIQSGGGLNAGNPFYNESVFPQFAGIYLIFASANWETPVFIQEIDAGDFQLVFQGPVPPDAPTPWIVDWIGCPITFPGAGMVVPTAGVTSVLIDAQPGQLDSFCLVSTNWETTVHVESVSSLGVWKFRFSTPVPAIGQVNYLFLPYTNASPNKAGIYQVQGSGSTTAAIPISTRYPFQPFVIPSWNTAVQIIKSPNALTVTFSTPAPAGALLYWGLHES